MPDFSFILDFPTNRVSVQEIIERRILEEVETFNSAQPEVFRGLV